MIDIISHRAHNEGFIVKNAMKSGHNWKSHPRHKHTLRQIRVSPLSKQDAWRWASTITRHSWQRGTRLGYKFESYSLSKRLFRCRFSLQYGKHFDNEAELRVMFDLYSVGKTHRFASIRFADLWDIEDLSWLSHNVWLVSRVLEYHYFDEL